MVELLHLDFDDAVSVLEELQDVRTIVELSDVCMLIAPLATDAVSVKLRHDAIQLSAAAYIVKRSDINLDLLSGGQVKMQDILDVEFATDGDARNFQILLRKRKKARKLNRAGRLLV